VSEITASQRAAEVVARMVLFDYNEKELIGEITDALAAAAQAARAEALREAVDVCNQRATDWHMTSVDGGMSAEDIDNLVAEAVACADAIAALSAPVSPEVKK
jgi:Tfp pilus assembly protein FimT